MYYTVGMKKNYFFLLALCLLLAPVGSFGEESVSATEIALEYGSGVFHIFTLPNGFTVFVREDNTAALLHTEFVCKAGYASQTPLNTGFFLLYSRIFKTGARSSTSDGGQKSAEEGVFETFPLLSSCNTNSTTFTADVPRNAFEDFVEALSQCVIEPDFSDAAIMKELYALKSEVQDYAATSSGFINAAIDSAVFSNAPWKEESGIFAQVLAAQNASEARTTLQDIRERYYTPENCALFITGAITVPQAYALALKAFSDWRRSDFDDSRRNDARLAATRTEQRRFVIADEALSDEMTQVVVQFTSLSMSQADILAASFTAPDSSYITAELSDPVVAVRSKDYLAASSVQHGNSSRLVLQALLEEPYSFTLGPQGAPNDLPSPVEQTVRFVSHAKEAAALTLSQFEAAQKEIAAKYRRYIGNPIQSMSLLADFWAMDAYIPQEKKYATSFYERFLSLAHRAESDSVEEIANAVQEEEPFVFMLVKDTVFQKYEAQFREAGFTLITKENAFWWQNKNLTALRPQTQENLVNDVPQKDILSSHFSAADFFYYKNAQSFYHATLLNGIPVFIKENEKSQSVVISLCIQGGELASPSNERFLRTVLVNAYAREMQSELLRLHRSGAVFGETTVKAWTEQTVSYISVECFAQEAKTVIEALFNALVYGEISPMTADRLVREQKNQWGNKIIMLDTQLEYNAFKYLWQGTAYESYYDQEAPILSETDLHSILLSYTQLLDASLHSFVIVGDIPAQEALDYVQNTFGLLHALHERTALAVPVPTFKNKTRRVQLRHLYSTNKTPEMAPDGVPILVPTTDFYDPAHYYFAAPDDIHTRDVYNALLYELQKRIQKRLPQGSTCTVQEARYFVPVGALNVDSILSLNRFLSAYRAAFTSLRADLREENAPLVQSIKNAWFLKTLVKTQTNEGTAALIQEGLLEGTSYQYLENYIAMENAVQEEFLAVLTAFFEDTPLFRVTSVDAKN